MEGGTVEGRGGAVKRGVGVGLKGVRNIDQYTLSLSCFEL